MNKQTRETRQESKNERMITEDKSDNESVLKAKYMTAGAETYERVTRTIGKYVGKMHGVVMKRLVVHQHEMVYDKSVLVEGKV